MRAPRRGFFYAEFRRPDPKDYGVAGTLVRFLVTVAALWVSQWLIPGFHIDSVPALVIGAIIFGLLNAFVKPVVAFVSCPLTIITLGLFLLVVNTIMLALTAWVAGLLGLEFHVEGFWAAFFGALIISFVSTVLTWWTDRNVLAPLRRDDSIW